MTCKHEAIQHAEKYLLRGNYAARCPNCNQLFAVKFHEIIAASNDGYVGWVAKYIPCDSFNGYIGEEGSVQFPHSWR